LARRLDISEPEQRFEKRVRLLWLLIVCGFLLLIGRISWLQLIEGERYRRLSENSRLRLIPLSPPRGLILDRNGERLAGDEASFSLSVIPSNIDDVDRLLDSLGRFLKIDKEIAKRKIREASNPFKPVSLKKNVDMSTIAFLMEREEEFPGTLITVHPVRSYPHGMVASHIIGYVGEVGKEELSSIHSFSDMEQGDLTGKMGIEKLYNNYLRGEKGGKQVEVDAYGRSFRTLSEKAPLLGNNVYLTIDLKLQEIAERELGERKGVVLVGDPHTGEILSMVSHPNFDPNLFAWGIPKEKWALLKEDPENPLENRAVKGEYAPASTFKIIVAAAALENKLIDKDDTFLCMGEFPIGNRVFRCWKEEGHGELNLEKAIVHSCDIFFYQLGLRVGVDKIIQFARYFGLGEPTCIDLAWEKNGFLPTSLWKKKNKREVWYAGDTANLSIGQGYILVTPIQMLNIVNVIANGGELFKPHLVKTIADSKGRTIREFSPGKVKKVPLSHSTLELLRKSLRGVVNEGTGWRARNRVVEISGKTGTAELSGEEKPHNWFIGYAPSDNPSLSIVVLVEHREEDISIAAEIAGKVLSQWFDKVVKAN